MYKMPYQSIQMLNLNQKGQPAGKTKDRSADH